MSLSGSVDYKLTRDALIDTAFEIAGIKDPERSLTGPESRTAVRLLNMMLKAWIADGLQLWKTDEGIILPVVAQTSYTLGPSGSNACLSSDLVTTAVDGAQTATTTLTVEDTTGIVAGDTVLVEVSDALVSGTVLSVASPVITFTASIASSIADGATVYAYTSKVERPTRITDARRISADGIEVPLMIVSRQEYFALSNKTVQGQPSQLYYDPQLTTGTAYIWPTFESVDDYIQFTFQRAIQDMDSASDDFDIPQEGHEAVTLGLADRLMTAFGGSDSRKMRIKSEAMEAKARWLDYDRDATSIFIQPTLR